MSSEVVMQWGRLQGGEGRQGDMAAEKGLQCEEEYCRNMHEVETVLSRGGNGSTAGGSTNKLE